MYGVQMLSCGVCRYVLFEQKNIKLRNK